jgi:hypothetical protein
MPIKLVQILVGFCISFTIILLAQSCKPSNFCCRSTPVSSAPNIEDPDSIFANYDRLVHQRIKRIGRILNRQDTMPAEYGITRESLQRTKDSLGGIARGLEQMKHSEVIYYFYYDSNKVEGHGVTEINPITNTVEMSFRTNYKNEEVIGHEIQHAIEYERGEISMKRDTSKGFGVLYDISDETQAYWFARLAWYNITANDHLNDSTVKADNPSMYDHLPNEHQDLSSPIGKQLKRNTEKEGAGGVPNSEFYKGWQKDYNKGRRLRSHPVKRT